MKIGWIRKLLYRINRKHKDMLFCTIFGREKYKKYALQLYNAVNKSSYTDVSDLEIRCIGGRFIGREVGCYVRDSYNF